MLKMEKVPKNRKCQMLKKGKNVKVKKYHNCQKKVLKIEE